MKKLLFVTDGYPADIFSEKVFVDSDLNSLRPYFQEILLVPIDIFPTKEGYANSLPEGVSVDWSMTKDKVLHSHVRRLIYLFHPFVIKSLYGMLKEAHTLKQWIKGFYQAANIIHISKKIRKILSAHTMTKGDTVLYSMWFRDAAGGLAYLAETGGWRMATRAHTNDLYDRMILFRSSNLRSRLMKSLDYVFTISERGRDYMRSKFPGSSNKIEFLPLGSIRRTADAEQAEAVSDKSPEKTLRFITTARLHPVKCLDLIMDVLDQLAVQLPSYKIMWTLIGDGECKEMLDEKKADLRSTNLKVIFTGALDNKEIQRIYAENPPDWYILMSRSEGLPISICEAMSHKIPIITTHVGDVGELVNNECAILLPAPFKSAGTTTSECNASRSESTVRTKPEEYVKLLLPVVTERALRDKMGAEALERWEENFNAEKLGKRLGELLSNLLG